MEWLEIPNPGPVTYDNEVDVRKCEGEICWIGLCLENENEDVDVGECEYPDTTRGPGPFPIRAKGGM